MHIIKQTSKKVAIPFFLLIAIMISGHVAVSQSAATGPILSITEFTIKPGQNFQFREGVKAWKACYLENEGTWDWNVWSRVQGEGNVYALTSNMMNWAEMDETDEAGRSCRDISRDLISPHVQSATNYLSRLMPDYSRNTPFDSEDRLVWVTYWRVNNGVAFREVVSEVQDARRSLEGGLRGYFYGAQGGGPDDFHYMMVNPHKNFASLDEPFEGAWTVLEKAKGEEARNQAQETFRQSVDNAWSYIYTWVEDMSR
jgi:hypothetical protein